MKKGFITVSLNTRPHIAHYLKHNFGEPCVIPTANFISKFLNSILAKPSKYREHLEYKYQPVPVKVSLTKTVFFRHGYSLSKTDDHNFTTALNNFIKIQIRTIAESIYSSQGVNEDWLRRFTALNKEHKYLLELMKPGLDPSTIKKSRTFEARLNKRIEEFKSHRLHMDDCLQKAAYECLGFNESVLSFDTIQRDYYRHKNSTDKKKNICAQNVSHF